MECKAIQPHFDIFARKQYIRPPKLFIISVIAVGSEPCLYEGALFLREPRDSIGIV
jgi:hypothetical protein